jgi:hypothetical protein
LRIFRFVQYKAQENQVVRFIRQWDCLGGGKANQAGVGKVLLSGFDHLGPVIDASDLQAALEKRLGK